MDNKIYLRLSTYLRNILFKKRFLARFNHNIQSFKLKRALAPLPSSQFDDTTLVERLKTFYLICDANFEGNKNSMWDGFFWKLQGDIHSALIDGNHEKILDILRNPRKHNLFYGFENLSRELINNKRLEDLLEPEVTMDKLLSLCEAVGVITMSNPESYRIGRAIDPDVAIKLLEKEFGFNLSIPNPFEGEFGIDTKRGILSIRAVHAIYQAWKISIILKDIPKPSILEIGGGLGRTAYYCQYFGLCDYTIVDIPMSSLSQGNFLGRVLPEKDIVLFGESNDPEDGNSKIKLIHPKAFFSSNRQYDLIVNVDSLTELGISMAKDYLRKISQVGNLFLSINHESNAFSVNSIWKEIPGLNRLYRNPCWVWRGYVEELFEAGYAAGTSEFPRGGIAVRL